MFFKPSSDLIRLDTPFLQINIFDSQERVFMKFFHNGFDIARGFVHFFHRLAYFAGSESMLYSLLSRIEKENISWHRLSRTA